MTQVRGSAALGTGMGVEGTRHCCSQHHPSAMHVTEGQMGWGPLGLWYLLPGVNIIISSQWRNPEPLVLRCLPHTIMASLRLGMVIWNPEKGLSRALRVHRGQLQELLRASSCPAPSLPHRPGSMKLTSTS